MSLIILVRCLATPLCPVETLAITELFHSTDEALFNRILKNSDHVMHHTCQNGHNRRIYNIRAKAHNKELISKTKELNDRYYLVRMLYRNIY